MVYATAAIQCTIFYPICPESVFGPEIYWLALIWAVYAESFWLAAAARRFTEEQCSVMPGHDEKTENMG